jgi:dipeptidyl aminopeptidase/acylaminoacyl peptidase
VDVKAKQVQQLTQDDFGCFEPDWSPDGKSIVCASTEGRDMATFADSANIYIVDLASHRRTALTTGPATKWLPSWSPDGKGIAYVASLRWGARDVYVTSSRGAKTVNVSSRLHRSVDEFVWSPDSKSLVVGFADGVSVLSIARLDVSSPGLTTQLDHGAASRSALTISQSGTLSWRESDRSSAHGIRILREGERSSYVLLDLNPEVATWRLGTQEVVRWKNHRKDNLEGILIKPVDFEEGKKYPLIVDAYPIHANGFMGWPMGGNQAWAGEGYAVFLPISRAPHFQAGDIKSESYTRAAKGPNGWNVTVDDVMSGVDELIRRGIVDPHRMGLYGFSNGGGTVNYLVTRTNRFKCAVSVAGAMSDWVRQSLMSTDSHVTEFEGGTSLWDDPYGYVKLSAVFHLNKVTTPMLFADGDADGDFLLDTVEMYSSLRQLGRKVTFVRYPDQSHGFTGTALKDFWERESEFFAEYLKPIVPASNQHHQ